MGGSHLAPSHWYESFNGSSIHKCTSGTRCHSDKGGGGKDSRGTALAPERAAGSPDEVKTSTPKPVVPLLGTPGATRAHVRRDHTGAVSRQHLQWARLGTEPSDHLQGMDQRECSQDGKPPSRQSE